MGKETTVERKVTPMSSVREPAVAGRFYPGARAALEKAIVESYLSPFGPGALPDEVLDHPLDAPRVLVVPHAGYMYSGPIAACGYAEIARRGRPAVTVILGPNHRGLTLSDTIETSGTWRTPLGDVPIESDVAHAITSVCPSLEDNAHGGRYEHALEVQVPFLQHLYGAETPIVPIMVSSHGMSALQAIAEAIAAALPGSGLIVCSTDMTHFESAIEAESQDALALAAIEAMDPEGLAQVIRDRRISMCGWAATAVGLAAARILDLQTCRVLRYGHSGLVSGDNSSVVAYASALVE